MMYNGKNGISAPLGLTLNIGPIINAETTEIKAEMRIINPITSNIKLVLSNNTQVESAVVSRTWIDTNQFSYVVISSSSGLVPIPLGNFDRTLSAWVGRMNVIGAPTPATASEP